MFHDHETLDGTRMAPYVIFEDIPRDRISLAICLKSLAWHDFSALFYQGGSMSYCKHKHIACFFLHSRVDNATLAERLRRGLSKGANFFPCDLKHHVTSGKTKDINRGLNELLMG